MQILKSLIYRIDERLVFGALLIINALPILLSKYAPSLDGPAHLYNAKLLVELLNNNESISALYSINQLLVPNWIGHFILTVLTTFLPSFLAEKGFLLIYLSAFPVACRRLILYYQSSNKYLSYLCFPLAYTTMFSMGFYNFSIGVVVLLWLVKRWISLKANQSTSRAIFSIMALFILLYFSHLLLYFFAISLLILHSLFFSTKSAKLLFSKSTLILLAAVTPSLVLAGFYLSQTMSANTFEYRSFFQNIDMLLHIQPLISYSKEKESSLLMLLLLSLLYLIFRAFIHGKKSRPKHDSSKTNNRYLIVVTTFILILYFILPDKGLNAGFISRRIAYLFFLFLFIYAGTVQLPRRQAMVGILLFLGVHLYLLKDYSKTIRSLSNTANDIEILAEQVEINATVLPINFNGNWLNAHFSNYLGVNKALLILENYEAGLHYFPLQLDYKLVPNYFLGRISDEGVACAEWINNPDNRPEVANYVLLLLASDDNANLDACRSKIMENIHYSYEEIERNNSAVLYGLKSS